MSSWRKSPTDMKADRILLAALPLSALILEILPCGAVLNFAVQAEDGTIETLRQTFSYFDLRPFGYANFAPLITAVLTCVILLLAAVHLFTGKLRRAVGICSGIAFVISLLPLCFGISYFSVVGALISALLLAQTLAALLKRAKE